MKPLFENIQPSIGSSFAFRRFTEENCSNLPYWHCHPEYEIVYITNGYGKRRIGQHLSYYQDGDLIFLGPNIPHLGFAQELYEPHQEIVIQMREDFLGKEFFQKPEMAEIRQLFNRAKTGITFFGETRQIIGHKLLSMADMDNFQRLITLLESLHIMARSTEYTSLGISHMEAVVKPQDFQRMREIYNFVQAHFKRDFSLSEIASAVNMTPSAFCRFFKKLNHRTFIEFLNEYRIANACLMLSQQHLSISAVSLECGFSNLSHFNRQFKAFTGETPSAYRKKLSNFVLSPLQVLH